MKRKADNITREIDIGTKTLRIVELGQGFVCSWGKFSEGGYAVEHAIVRFLDKYGTEINWNN